MRWLRRIQGDQHVDLSQENAVTTALIARPLDWRVRAVEHIDLDTATTCTRRRSLQAAPLRPLLPPGMATHASTALVVLNVASVPRNALLDLDIEGPEGKPAFLLPRDEIARREANYLLTLATDAGLQVDDNLQLLLRSVLRHPRTGWEVNNERTALSEAGKYLSDGFGVEVPEAAVRDWIRTDTEIAALLKPYADAADLSPTEHPILGLPDLVDVVDLNRPAWTASVSSVLKAYLALVSSAAQAGAEQPSYAGELLTALADYGRNYDMLVATWVPLDEPFLIKYSERRQVNYSTWRNQAQQDLVISDAGSNHVVLNVTDPNVRITKFIAWSIDRTGDAFGAFTTTDSPQTRAVYAYDADRDYRVLLEFTVKPLRRLSYIAYLTTALLLLLSAAVIHEHPARLQDLALIVGPSALAASVLLNREPSTLGSRLRLRSTFALGGALSILLLVSSLVYLWPKVSH